jgi:hypothetical protein
MAHPSTNPTIPSVFGALSKKTHAPFFTKWVKRKDQKRQNKIRRQLAENSHWLVTEFCHLRRYRVVLEFAIPEKPPIFAGF